MPKLTIPSDKPDIILSAGKMKTIIDSAVSKEAEYMVKVQDIQPIPGFNVRIRDTTDYRTDLDALKQSIRENGFYPNKPLAGFIGKSGDADVIFVTDGHRRLEAVNEINEEDVDGTQEIKAIPVVLRPKETSLDDLTIALVQDNSGRPLTPFEMGVVVKRLMNSQDAEGKPTFTKADIARRLSITERYIDDLMLLVAAPAKVRTAVLEGNVSSTLAIQEMRRDPKKAEERLTTAVTKAKAAGKAKATKKDISTVKMQTIRFNVSMATGDTMGDVLKTVAAEVRKLVPHADKDAGDQLQVDGTLTISVEIPKPDAPAKAEKPAKRKQSVQKPSKANGGVGGAPVEPEAPKKTAAKKTKPAADEGDEPVKLPPKVPTVESDDPDDI